MDAPRRVALLARCTAILVKHQVDEGLDHTQLRLGAPRVMLRRRQGTRDRPAHDAPMNTKFCRHAGNRADPKLMLPTELFEQLHFGFPVHERHPDPIGITVGSRTGGGPKLASTPGPKFDSIAARVATDGQSIDAQARQLTKAGCKKASVDTGYDRSWPRSPPHGTTANA
jgi:hypothetical protein